MGRGSNPVQVFVGFAETVISQSLALSKTPFELLRGSGGEEKVLKNAKDACATEALEIATYTALERLAARVGDEQTARLAASIRGDEERMLERVMREIPELTDAVLGADVEGKPSYEITKTGAADADAEGRARGQASGTRDTGPGQAYGPAGAQGPGRRAGRGTDQGGSRVRGGSRDRAL